MIGGFAGAAIAHAIAVHGFFEYTIVDGAKSYTSYWYDTVNWYTAGKDGGFPSGVLIIIAFIV